MEKLDLKNKRIQKICYNLFEEYTDNNGIVILKKDQWRLN